MDNKLEYIPGDLVMTNGVPLGTAKDVVYRVTSSDPSKTLELGDGTVLKGIVCLENIEGAEFGEKGYLLGDSCAWVKDIVPIPLTSEILEKNGWICYRSEGECFGHRWYKHQEYPFTLRYNNFLGIIGVSFNDGKDDTVMIKCVDELQHILFGLQLDSNLKI